MNEISRKISNSEFRAPPSTAAGEARGTVPLGSASRSPPFAAFLEQDSGLLAASPRRIRSARNNLVVATEERDGLLYLS